MKTKSLLLKEILLIALMLLLSLLLSCATSAPDVYACVELTIDRGYCTKTISNESRYIDDTNKLDDKSWWELRPYMIQLPINSWIKIKTYIIKTCKKYGNCEQEIADWDRKLDKIDDIIERKLGD